MKKEISLLCKHLKPFMPLMMIAIILLFIVIIVATVSEDPTKMQFAVLQEEFRQHGVRGFVSGDASAVLLEDVKTKERLIELIDIYQPKIVYYFKTLTYVRFTFYEDEAEKIIVYRWFYDWTG